MERSYVPIFRVNTEQTWYKAVYYYSVKGVKMYEFFKVKKQHCYFDYTSNHKKWWELESLDSWLIYHWFQSFCRLQNRLRSWIHNMFIRYLPLYLLAPDHTVTLLQCNANTVKLQIAWPSLGQWLFVLERGSLSHWLFIAPGREANEDILKMTFQSPLK